MIYSFHVFALSVCLCVCARNRDDETRKELLVFKSQKFIFGLIEIFSAKNSAPHFYGVGNALIKSSIKLEIVRMVKSLAQMNNKCSRKTMNLNPSTEQR